MNDSISSNDSLKTHVGKQTLTNAKTQRILKKCKHIQRWYILSLIDAFLATEAVGCQTCLETKVPNP